jgi:hypothetical protein
VLPSIDPIFGSGIPPGPNSHPTLRSPLRFRLLQPQSALPTVCDSFATYRPITHSPASTICRCIASALNTKPSASFDVMEDRARIQPDVGEDTRLCSGPWGNCVGETLLLLSCGVAFLTERLACSVSSMGHCPGPSRDRGPAFDVLTPFEEPPRLPRVTSGRDIDDPSAYIRAPIRDRDDDTAAIGVIGNAHSAPEGQCFMRGGQCAIMQSATAGSPCAKFSRRIMRCDTAFGARCSHHGREYGRRKDKCLHAFDYSVEERPQRQSDSFCYARAICVVIAAVLN